MTDNVKSGPTTCIAGSQHINLTASTALAVPSFATWAIVKPRGGGIYMNLRGAAATSADMAISADVAVEITSNLADVRMIQQAAGAIADVWYFG